MAFLWGPSSSQVEFDALLEKTTSDLLPSSAPPDLLASLQLADLIRSSAIPPLAATKSLLRRLKHENPNVQLLALSVLDICVKNGGTPFLVQVAGKESASDIESLARGTPSGNRDVKEKVMSKLQDWATAFAAKENLRSSELVRSYERMKNEGLPFPPRDPTATAAMVDSLSAPEWKDAPYCTRCRTEFTTFNRKHHCRNCGDVFDQACSGQSAPLPHFGITEPVRVCDGCMKKVKDGKGAVGLGRSSSLGAGGAARPGLPERSSTVSYGASRKHRSASASIGKKSKEDEDLQRAIEASLKDVNGSDTSGPAFELRKPQASGYNPSYSAPTSKAAPAPVVEDDDPDLAAAIAASLRDVAPAPSAPFYNDEGPAATYASLYHTKHESAYPSLSTASSYTPSASARFSLPSYDLSPTESSTLHDFTSTLTQPQPRLGHRERELYEQARQAAPRLERGLEDAERRREILVEMNAKLGEATRLYQGLLEEGSRSRSSYSPYAQQHQPQQSYYPAPAPPAAYQQQPQHSHYAPTSYAPQPDSHYAYHPQPLGQPLPYAQAPQAAPLPPSPLPMPGHNAEPPHQAQHAPPQHHQQPAGYYKPSQFPSVPSGPAAALFPAVPVEQPWEEEERRRREEEDSKVGELIEL